MKKILLFLLLFLALWGCEKDFDSTVDTQTYSYQVVSLSSFSSFRYVVGDSLITVFLALNSSAGVNKVFFDIYASDGLKLNSEEVQLLDNGNASNGDQTAGDNRYTNRFPLSKTDPIGRYTIKFFVTDKGNATKQVAVQNFTYDNAQSNVAPMLLDLVIPETVARNESFIFTVTAEDLNGLSDIEFVYFELYRPDGTIVEENPGDTIFSMHDDGNFEVFGDEVPGDGIYSFKNSFSSTAQLGTWRFEFQARDRGGALSNKIIHNIVVQ